MQQEDIKTKLYAEAQSLYDRQDIMDQVNMQKDYGSMKERMNELIRDTELSKIVDKQEARIRKKERSMKQRKLKFQMDQKSEAKVTTTKNHNYVTREMIV